jgi:HPt (histidine-containing phosphotransfer) domain-containing protein
MQGPPLRSKYAHDPDMAELVRLFVDELPERLKAVSAAWEGQRLSDLKRLAHQLRGASGGYGYPTIGAAAGALEDRIAGATTGAEPDLESIRKSMDELLDLCRRAAP